MSAPKAVRITLLVSLWLVTTLQGLAMIDAGWGKFKSFDGWWYWFGQFGFPGWLSPTIGGVEILGGLLLFVPSLATYSAVVLMGVMTVAFYSIVTTPQTAMSPTDPVVAIALLFVVAAGFWKKRRQLPKTDP